jgi:hypothetical protein
MMNDMFLRRLKNRVHSYGMLVLCVGCIFYRAGMPTAFNRLFSSVVAFNRFAKQPFNPLTSGVATFNLFAKQNVYPFTSGEAAFNQFAKRTFHQWQSHVLPARKASV